MKAKELDKIFDEGGDILIYQTQENMVGSKRD